MSDVQRSQDRASSHLPAWLRSGAVAWAGALMATLVAALTAGFLMHEAQSVETNELQSAELYARVLQDHADRTFDTVDIALSSLVDTLATEAHAGDLGHAERDLTQALGGLPFMRSLSLVTTEGRVLASSSAANTGILVDLSVVALPAGAAVDRLGTSTAGRDLVDVQAGRPTGRAGSRTFLPLARALGPTAPDLHVVAVLNPDFFANAYELTLADTSRSAAMFSIDARMVTGTSSLHKLPGERMDGHRFYTDFLPARESGSFVGPGIDGTQVVTAFRVLRRRPLVVIVERGHAQALGGFRSTLVRALGMSGAALLLILAMVVLARRSLKAHEAVSDALEASRADIACEREAAQQVLQSQLKFTAQLLEVSPTPLFVKDVDGRFTTVNHAWLTLMNLTQADVLGRTSADLFADDATRHLEQDARLHGSEERIRYESRLLVRGRAVRDAIVTKVRFTRADGSPAGIVGSIVDVTEFREAERDIREARDAAQAANNAKSEFIANISHELRTPLQGIIGFSEIGRDMAADLPDFMDMFADIHAGGQRMLTLVNALLDVSQMDSAVGSLPLQRADVAQQVRDAIGQMQARAAARDQRFMFDGLDRVLQGDVDRLRFPQALRNVLANAIRYAPVGGVIEVRASGNSHTGIEITVRDHGPGIPEGELESIFEPFVQSSRTRDGSGGTGLGLTIARKIMSAHGGSIVAANAVGGGALFTLLLPFAGAIDRTRAAVAWQETDILPDPFEVT